jgi:3-oxoacyl-[acyl-carrier-protein] synthase II
MKDSGLDMEKMDPRRIGVVEGTTVSGADSVMNMQNRYKDKQSYRAVHPYDIVSAYCGEGSSSISLYLGLKGPAMTYCSGCASSNDAIGYAVKMIQDDELDVVLAGGSEEVTEMLFAGFCKLRSMSENNENPTQAARPFDRKRDGFVLGEGSVFLMVEELTHALARGANIYAEIIGHGRSSEAYHATDPDPEGMGYRAALEQALREAKISGDEIDYLNAHGSGTPKNDPIETYSVKKIFGAQAYRLGISASKPVLGHMMGASGSAESAVTVLAIKHECMPPTINLTDPDDGCDLDYVLQPRAYPIRAAANLNAGFGGRYSCLIFRRFENGVSNGTKNGHS